MLAAKPVSTNDGVGVVWIGAPYRQHHHDERLALDAAACAAGEVATGGGVLSSAANGGVAAVRSSEPQPDTAGATPTSWRVIVENVADPGTVTATAYVVCAATL